MAQVFICTGVRKGKNQVIANRYKFVDGVMIINDEAEAKLMQPILCDFYACEMKPLEKYEADLAAQSSARAIPPASGTK